MENTVFILEQDALSAKTLSESLEYLGCKPLVFSTLKSAEENINMHRPEIFLLNPVLLSCNRQECFETIGKLKDIAPVIFLARRRKEGERRKAKGGSNPPFSPFSKGGWGDLSKPPASNDQRSTVNGSNVLYQPFTLTQLQEVVSSYVQLERGFLFAEQAKGSCQLPVDSCQLIQNSRPKGEARPKGAAKFKIQNCFSSHLTPHGIRLHKLRLWAFLFFFSILSGFFLSTVVLPAGENIFLSMKYLSSFPQRLEGYLQRDETRELERR